MSLQAIVTAFVKGKERVSVASIGVHVVHRAFEELGLPVEPYKDTIIAYPLLWKGATQVARNVLKRDLSSELDQDELFDGDFSEFLRVPGEEEEFIRRRALMKEQYALALAALDEKSDHLVKRIDGLRRDFDTAEPFWTEGLTFAEAYTRAVKK